MLEVKTIAEISSIIQAHFGRIQAGVEDIPIEEALGRVLAAEIKAAEYVPDFNRSTVDGYALRAADTFGCSEAIPALLTLIGETSMGVHSDLRVGPAQCVYVPTGGEILEGADAVAMLEDVEDYGAGSLGILKACAPGANTIFRGDDVAPGDLLYSAGARLRSADIGALAALGIAQVSVKQRPLVALISTGDELVPAGAPLSLGMIRDVNAPMLAAAIRAAGADVHFLGILADEETIITTAMQRALQSADMLILTGGTSVGVKDAIPAAVSGLGQLLVHGVAAKPGKPTLVGEINHKPVFGLPGNPVAAYFMFLLFVRPLLYSMLGASVMDERVSVPIARAVPSNHGREDLLPVSLKENKAHPIIGKSGLITTLSGADGYIRIPRDCEGLRQGELVEVILFRN